MSYSLFTDDSLKYIIPTLWLERDQQLYRYIEQMVNLIEEMDY